MTVTHAGSTKQYATNWDTIFARSSRKKAAGAAGATQDKAKKPAKKAASPKKKAALAKKKGKK